MAMHCKGLTKLIEECGELTQVAAKKQAYLDDKLYPDGSNLEIRLQEEIADVLAAIDFVIITLKLDDPTITARMHSKFNQYIERAKQS